MFTTMYVVYMQLCVVIGIAKPCKYLTCISLSAIPVAVFLPWGGLEVFGPSHRGRLCQQSIRLHLVQVPSQDRWDTSRQWSITNADEGARYA